MQTRRDFLKAAGLAVPAWKGLSGLTAGSPSGSPWTERFVFGASVYPDIDDGGQSKAILDLLAHCHMNLARVGESSWGNLELAPGEFNFGWLGDFLDQMHQRGMAAILGTSSYIPPQWLAAAHPEILVVLAPGSGASDPMVRKCPCLNHPLYRAACKRYIQALAQRFHDHPAVIGWQLDNEIEFVESIICYNPACEQAWREWLKRTFRTPDEFNDKLDLADWGLKIQSFDEVPQPRRGVEGGSSSVHEQLPALSLAEFHFRRDTILGFLAEQAALIRAAGAQQWILTDWNPLWTALADDPQAQAFLSIAGLNYYQESTDKPENWNDAPWHLDMHRSCYGEQRFIVTETRIGIAGGTGMWDPAPSREQFRMWDLQLAAFGACGMMYWSGNRWRGGHWPHWGGLMDWSGRAEPDAEWAAELGAFFEKWGPTLLAHPVESRAAVLTDFDNRAALEIYPTIANSRSVFTGTFAALHRLGIGTDTVNAAQAEHFENLKKYNLLVLAAAAALDSSAAIETMRQFVLEGGTLIVTPFTAYADSNGIFRGDGFAANLAGLTGSVVRTVRWTGSPERGNKTQLLANWNGPVSGRSPVALDGYMEYLEIGAQDTNTIAAFSSEQSIVDGKPAATLRKLGRGQVIKLAFWPADDSFLTLVSKTCAAARNLLATHLPDGVLAVPRTDNSLFVINVTSRPQSCSFHSASTDRIAQHTIAANTTLQPYETLWLETSSPN
jgi:beta-galactosidase